MSRSPDFARGTLDLLIHRLGQLASIRAEWRATATGRMAKFYLLTVAGRDQLEKELEGWACVSSAMNPVVREA